MKRGLKKNYKLILGIIVGIMISSVGVYATNMMSSSDITYDNSQSGLISTNMKDAIDELNTKSTKKIDAAKKSCSTDYGYKCSKICQKKIGSGENMGDKIQCGTEGFYILKNDGTHITAIAEYNLQIGYNAHNGLVVGPVSNTNIQNKECIGSAQGSTTFQGVNYNTGTCVIMYTNRDEFSAAFTNYKHYLTSTNIGFSNNIEVEIPSSEWMIKAGCSETTDSCPDWVASGSFWLSDYKDSEYVYTIYKPAKKLDYTANGNPIAYGIRPIIILPANVI